jgi:nucleotide-binding universal stress UspA family protein
MMRSIMVPLDGSDFAERALPLARTLAARTGATLHFVMVHDIAVLPLSMDGAGLASGQWVEDARKQESEYLEGVAAAARSAGCSVRTALLEVPIVEALASYVARAGIDLVFMTTHGRGGLSRLWLGSVADGLARRTDVPLWLVRPGAEGPPPTSLPRHVLIPLDGSARSEAILALGLEVAALRPSTVTLLHVVPPPFVAGQPYAMTAASFDEQTLRQEQNRAASYLARMAERVPAPITDLRQAVVTDPSVSRAILQHATEQEVDLIACVTHGRGALARAAIGSVADKLIRGSQASILVLRALETGTEPRIGAEDRVHAAPAIEPGPR